MLLRTNVYPKFNKVIINKSINKFNKALFLIHRQQGFGILIAALAKQTLPLLTGLLQDLQLESGLTSGSNECTPDPADLDILGNYSGQYFKADLLNMKFSHYT